MQEDVQQLHTCPHRYSVIIHCHPQMLAMFNWHWRHAGLEKYTEGLRLGFDDVQSKKRQKLFHHRLLQGVNRK